MTILIVEDEQPAAERLRRLVLRLLPTAGVVGLVPSVRKGHEWLAQHPLPDLLLADIQLTDGLSFELLRALPRPVPIVFCTAYDEYALQAFRHNGYDYLLKPIEEEALAGALARVQQRQAAPLPAAPPDLGQFARLLAAFQPAPDYRSRFLMHHRDELLVVPATEVAYVYSEHRTTFLMRLDGTRFALDETLEQVEASLDPRQFFRLSRQYLARLTAIQKVQKHFDGKLWVQLAPAPADVLVSRLTAPALKQWLNR